MATQVMLMGIIVMAFLIGDLSNIMSNLDVGSERVQADVRQPERLHAPVGFRQRSET